MPELPEVEVLCRHLSSIVGDALLDDCHFYADKLRQPIPVQQIKSLARKQRIIDVQRRSKYMLWMLENQSALIMHLGMSGYFMEQAHPTPLQKHTHAVFALKRASDQGTMITTYLHYIDPRRFGLISLLEHISQLDSHALFQHLGCEPLGLSSRQLAEHLFKHSRNRNLPIKNFLMNGQFVVGVGNIYANESLFMAGIHPQKIARCVTMSEYTSLAQSIQKVLRMAIKKGGTSLKDFRNTDGQPGYFQINLKVYGRAGQKCVRCRKELISFLIQSGRRSYFCSRCQPLN